MFRAGEEETLYHDSSSQAIAPRLQVPASVHLGAVTYCLGAAVSVQHVLHRGGGDVEVGQRHEHRCQIPCDRSFYRMGGRLGCRSSWLCATLVWFYSLRSRLPLAVIESPSDATVLECDGQESSLYT